MSNPNSPPTPRTITGGCLCGSVRYKIDFSPSHDWKHGPHTCQCTQCRKNSGSLIYYFHTVTSSELTFLSETTYTEYNSSPGCYRSFCRECGSPLAWMNRAGVENGDTEIEIAVGSIDEEFLIGKKDGNGGFAEKLASLDGDHFYVENEIKGITDTVSGMGRGTRFWRGSKEGKMGGGEKV